MTEGDDIKLGLGAWLVAAWGICGVQLLLLSAIRRLVSRAWEVTISGRLTVLEWVAAVAWILIMAYAEGYRGFQQRLAPRAVGRALRLAGLRRPVLVAFAPLFCLGLLHATRRRMLTSWGLWGGIVALVLLVRHLPVPWRGIVDAGVVVGLTWGVVSLFWAFARALVGRPLPAATDLPGDVLLAQTPTPSNSALEM